LRSSNAKVCDEKVQQVLDTLQPLCPNLTTYARLKTGIKSTHQVESINSVIKTRISSMHGFKSFESARLITNALAGFNMFKRFGRNAKYEGRRPVDLCFSPEPRGTWIDYCLKI
jgi:transposase-like protein